MGPSSELGELTAGLGRGNMYLLSQAELAKSQDFGGQAGHVNGDVSRCSKWRIFGNCSEPRRA